MKKIGFMFLGFMAGPIYVFMALLTVYLFEIDLFDMLLFRLLPVVFLYFCWRKFRSYFFWIVLGMLFNIPLFFFIGRLLFGGYSGWV